MFLLEIILSLLVAVLPACPSEDSGNGCVWRDGDTAYVVLWDQDPGPGEDWVIFTVRQ